MAEESNLFWLRHNCPKLCYSRIHSILVFKVNQTIGILKQLYTSLVTLNTADYYTKLMPCTTFSFTPLRQVQVQYTFSYIMLIYIANNTNNSVSYSLAMHVLDVGQWLF